MFGGANLTRSRVLDVGCSAGLITRTLASVSQLVVGVDIDPNAVAYAQLHRIADEPALFTAASGEALPFASETFDIVVCNHVYEHVRDSRKLMDEVHRVLKPGGYCYFAGGHRLQLLEPHYRLPLLSWLPQTLADHYLRWSKRGEHYREEFLLPWQLHSMFAGFSSARFVSGAMLHEWRRFELSPDWWPKVCGDRLPRPMALVASWLAPTYVWLVRK